MHKLKLAGDLKKIWKGPSSTTSPRPIARVALLVPASRSGLTRIDASRMVHRVGARRLRLEARPSCRAPSQRSASILSCRDAAAPRERCAAAWKRLRTDRAGRQSNVDWNASSSLRVQRLGPLLASWETVGGCGAGRHGRRRPVKWIGRDTTGGLFQWITQANYIHLDNGYNSIVSTQLTTRHQRELERRLLRAVLYKYYNDYMGLPVDISNAGLGDSSLLVTRALADQRDQPHGLGRSADRHATTPRTRTTC